jgi:hypothetical protein
VPDSTSVKIVAAMVLTSWFGWFFTFESGFVLCRYRPFEDLQLIVGEGSFRPGRGGKVDACDDQVATGKVAFTRRT